MWPSFDHYIYAAHSPVANPDGFSTHRTHRFNSIKIDALSRSRSPVSRREKTGLRCVMRCQLSCGRNARNHPAGMRQETRRIVRSLRT